MAYPAVSGSREGRVAPGSPFHDIVERAYEVFSCPAPADIGVCTCPMCCDPDVRRQFFSRGQRGLPLAYLTEWLHSDLTSDFDQKVWTWLLPRIIEALASGAQPSRHGIEVTLDRFPTGRRELWTPDEWQVIDAFQRLFIERFETGVANLDDVLAMFSLGGWDAGEIFQQILSWPDERLADVLAHDWLADEDGGQIAITAFWHDESVPRALWTSPVLEARMMRAARDEAGPDDERSKALAVARVIASEAGR